MTAAEDRPERSTPEAIAEGILDGLDFGDGVTPSPEAIGDAIRSGWFNGWDVLGWIERAVKEARA